MTIRRLAWPAAAAVAVLVGGCASQDAAGRRVPSSQTFDVPPAEAVQRIEGFLEQQGVRVTTADPERGLIRARQAPLENSAWAACEDRVIDDSEGERRRHVDAERTLMELAVDVGQQGGQTQVTVRPTFEATYHNSFINRDFQARCSSTGELEQALFQAI